MKASVPTAPVLAGTFAAAETGGTICDGRVRRRRLDCTALAVSGEDSAVTTFEARDKEGCGNEEAVIRPSGRFAGRSPDFTLAS